MRLSGALFWMSHFPSCNRGGGRIEWIINLYYDRPASGKRRLIRGGGLVTWISDECEPQFPVVGEDLPFPATRDVVASRVGAVRPLETIDQQNREVGNSFRLPCSDSDNSDEDVLSVGAVRPLTTAVPLG